MNKKAAYKIKEINGFWRYHVYKKSWFGWRKIAGSDYLEQAEAKVAESAKSIGSLLYDIEGKRI